MFGFSSLPLHWKSHLRFGSSPSALQTGEVRDTWRLRDGTAVTLRAVRQEDGVSIQEFVRGLSMRTRYHRFFSPIHELAPELLERFTLRDPKSAITLLATTQHDGREAVVAMGQYVAEDYPASCDFAVVVADDLQRGGLGTRLIQTLICIARAAGIHRIEGDILAENEPMRRLMRQMGFTLMRHDDGPALRKVVKELDVPKWKCSPLSSLATQAKREESSALAKVF